MRLLLVLLVFAIGFGGYSAAAHAFAADPCAATMEKGDGCADQGHDAPQAEKSGTDDHKSSKTACLHCHHGCTSHALGIPLHVIDYRTAPERHDAAPSGPRSDYFTFSLLRPPRPLA